MSSPPSAPSPAAPGGHFPNHRRIFLETAAVVVASLVLLIPYYHLPLSEADEGIIATGAERILRGQIPYRDFFSELGPASFYLQAVIFKLGAINVTALRLTAWLLGGAISGLIYLLARKVMGGFRASFAASIFLLICYPSAYRVSHHWWANLFLMLTVLSLDASFPPAPGASNSRRRGWLLLAGFLAATTLLSMQSKGFWAIVMGSAFLIIEPYLSESENRGEHLKLGLRQAAWFLTGSAATIATVAGYFAFHGALGAWVDDNVVFLFTNYRTYLDVPQASVPQIVIHMGRLALTQPTLHSYLYFAGYLFFFFLAPAMAFGGTAWQLLSVRRPQLANSRILLLLLLEGAGAFFSEHHSPDVSHSMWAAPLMLILLVYQWGWVVSRSRVLRRPAMAVAMAAAALLLFTAGRKVFKALRIDGRVETRRGIVYVRRSSVDDARQIMSAIQQRVQPGGETFFYPYLAELYFLTATRNPTRLDVVLPDFHSASDIEEAIACLKSTRPEFVFSFDKIQRWTVRPHFPDDLPDVFTPHLIERAFLAPDSGYYIAARIASGYDIGFHSPPMIAEVEVWAARQ